MDSYQTFALNNEPMVPASIFADRPMKLLQPEEYPNSDWSTTRANYELCWAYYKGFVLNKKAGDNRTLLYPVKLNIVRAAVINHAAVHLGQYEDDRIATFGIRTGLGYDEQKEETGRIMNLLWSINDGDDLLIEQALAKQIFGGVYWKVAWTPTRRKWPIRIFAIDPRAVYAVWDGQDVNRLISIDVHYQIPRPVASTRYRVDLRPFSTNGSTPADAEYVTVHEHWDENEWFIKVDEEFGKWPTGNEMYGVNPYIDPVLGHPIIPFVYEPRNRIGEGMYGEALPPGLMGPQNEVNNTLAHVIDGIADAVHQQPWVRNRQKGVDGLTKARNEWVDLGMQQMGRDAPEAGRLKGADITKAMTEFATDDLLKLAREHVSLPDVAWGRTDASIRSALTLKFMMWPTLNLGLRYRKHSSTAMKWLWHKAFVIAYTQNNTSGQRISNFSSLGVPDISPEMIEAVIAAHKTHWPVMLPDDRVELVNEMVQRITNDLVDPETAISRLDGPDDLEAILNRIDEYRQKLHDKEVDLAQSGFEARQKAMNQQGNKTSDTSRQAQAKGGRKSGGSSR